MRGGVRARLERAPDSAVCVPPPTSKRRHEGKAKTASRGYGIAHQRLRKRWAPVVALGGVRCARGRDCKRAEVVGGVLVGGLIAPGTAWDLGHDDHDRRRYTGPEHRGCNRATAGRRRRWHSRDW